VRIHDAGAVSTALRTEDHVFESLYRLNRPIVYAYALSRLRNPSDAEDVTQATFLNAYTALRRGVTPRDELQWLLAIARNVCHDRFRNAKRRPQEEPLDDGTAIAEPEGPEYSFDEVCRQIGELHPRHRQILLMREFEGRSYGEISAQLGVSEAAVQALLSRARRTLREELELGITCSQARRISLRHLNGVAVRDERRALHRHLRRCGDCAEFVGRRPRAPLAQLLWLPTLPFRKLGALLFGTGGAPAGGGAIAAKVLALTAIGTTAVGVTLKKAGAPSTPSHSPAAPRTRPAPSPPPVQRAPVQVRSTPVSSSVASRAPAARAPLTHATTRAARPREKTVVPREKTVVPSAPAAIVAPPVRIADLPPAPTRTPADAAPEPPDAPTHVDAGPVPEAAPPPPDEPATAPPAAETPVVASVAAQPADTPAPAADASPTATEPPAATGGPSPPSTSPPPTPGNGNTHGYGDELGVGRSGTPPGHDGPKPQDLGAPKNAQGDSR
jgi:RNA polymerase sigma factor (sigma-70 family)